MLPWLLAIALAPPDTFTVDPGGGGDFTTIEAAIDAASAGDTILVGPGEYDAIELTKALSILGLTGAHAPKIRGVSRVIEAGPVCLSGLELQTLRLNGIVGGTVVVDHCTIGIWDESFLPMALQIQECPAVLVGHCEIRGGHGGAGGASDGGPAADVEASRAVFTDCSLRGAHGKDDESLGGDGGDALRATLGSWVDVAGCDVIGGDEGSKICICSLTGAAGDGVYASASTVGIRGSASNFVYWGQPRFGIPQGDGYAIRAVSAAHVVTSGVSLPAEFGTKADASSSVLQLEVPEPFLEFGPEVAPGSTATVSIYGPAGAPELLVVSLGVAPVPLASFDDWLWPSLAGGYLMVAVSTSGQESPLTLSAVLPRSGLEGAKIWLQAASPGLPSSLVPGASFLGNPDVLVIRE